MENVLNSIGPFGRYQKFVLVLSGLICSLTATTIYSTIFSAADPGLICSFKNDSTEIANLPNQCEIWSIIKDNKKFNKTSFYECHFDDKYYGITMVSEWNLICERAFLAGLTQTIYMIGTVCGLFIGFFSDKYGRKACSFVLIVLMSIVLILSELVQINFLNLSTEVVYVIYCIGQFLIGALAKAIYAVLYILILELTTSKYATIFSNVYLYMYVLGELFVLAIGYFFRNWHTMNIFMAGYSLVFVFIIWFFIPESPRYLISLKRTDDALKLLRKMARFNKKEASQDYLSDAMALNNLLKDENADPTTSKQDEEQEIKTTFGRLRYMWSPRQNLIKTILFVYIWFALALIYYGVSLGITSLDDDINPYLMYLLSSLAEIVGYACCHLNDIFGRKRTMIGFLMMASVVCLVVAVVPAGSKSSDGSLTWNSIIKIIFASIGKAMASAAFNSCYIFNSLLYPTKVRTTIVLFASNIGRIGSYVSPQINLLQTAVWRPLPYIIFSSSAFVASIFVFFLPDPNRLE